MEGRSLAGVPAPVFPAEPGPSRAVAARATRVCLRTLRSNEIIDLTPRVESFVRSAKLDTGWVNVQCRHTTVGLLVNEDEPLLLEDLSALLERLAPRDIAYGHDELQRRDDVPADERPNGHAHARASLLRTSETLNVVDGALQLGRWQRVLLFELDGPRRREVSLVALGVPGRP